MNSSFNQILKYIFLFCLCFSGEHHGDGSAEGDGAPAGHDSAGLTQRPLAADAADQSAAESAAVTAGPAAAGHTGADQTERAEPGRAVCQPHTAAAGNPAQAHYNAVCRYTRHRHTIMLYVGTPGTGTL